MSHPPSRQTQTSFHHRVRYHEADAQGFLFNSRYLEIADVGLTEFFRDRGLSYDSLVAGGTDPSVVKADLTFRRPARFDDLLLVSVSCTAVGRSSFRLATEVTSAGEQQGTKEASGGEPVASIDITYVNVDARAGLSRPLPPPIAELLAAAAEASSSAVLPSPEEHSPSPSEHGP